MRVRLYWLSRVTLFCILLSGCYGHKVTVDLPIPPGLPDAPAAFTTPPSTNGHESQSDMDNDRSQFEQDASVANPQVSGPFFNSLGCVDCHNNPATGGTSIVFEHRVSPDDVGSDPDDQVAPATLVHSGSVPGFPQQVSPHGATNALRRSLSLNGDGFVEAIPATVFKAIAAQNGGQIIMVNVLESPGTKAIGRFGWKDQEPTLLSFAGDAACNEMGEENRLVNGFNCDNKPPTNGIEDNDNPTPARPEDIDNYRNFMQSLPAPPVGISTPQTTVGAKLFMSTGCAWCHVPTLYTQGLLPRDVQFHPFGDYLLHDIGTGDGIAQGGAPANKVRTTPLWGISRQDRFLHDGRAFDAKAAIEAHQHEAGFARKNFNHLSGSDQQALLAFLGIL
jgi:CxxC motif-containing protein (DUF1111 family)